MEAALYIGAPNDGRKSLTRASRCSITMSGHIGGFCRFEKFSYPFDAISGVLYLRDYGEDVDDRRHCYYRSTFVNSASRTPRRAARAEKRTTGEKFPSGAA